MTQQQDCRMCQDPIIPQKGFERLPQAIMARPAPGYKGVLSLADFLNLC
jgi:hypothetical protein